MTNLEYIQSCTKEELAKFLCQKLTGDCEDCVAKETCFCGRNGFHIWLDKERRTDEAD